jgi:hypothetical protein
MSDYGDDYSDYGDEFYYVEEEYVVADDLAEHAVPSPPPTVYDEDALLDWDRFDYYNDLEYASDGYDEASFAPNHGTGAAKIGQKRKRGASTVQERKRRRVVNTVQEEFVGLSNSPVVWRSQASRERKPRMLAENVKPYALLKDWRKKTADAPKWGSASATPAPVSADEAKALASGAISPGTEDDEIEEEGDEQEGCEEDEEEEAGLDPTALMAVLQERLSAAGGPLNGMDPQQLLQFAMRMANDKDAGDDIAGEMADEMLGMDDEEEGDEGAEEKLLSWVAQQRNAGKHSTNGASAVNAPKPKSPVASRDSEPLLTPPSSSSDPNRSIAAAGDTTKRAVSSTEKSKANAKTKILEVKQVTRKRKAADTSDTEASTVTTKRRATRSFDAPTASSQARTAASKTTRSGRVKR